MPGSHFPTATCTPCPRQAYCSIADSTGCLATLAEQRVSALMDLQVGFSFCRNALLRLSTCRHCRCPSPPLICLPAAALPACRCSRMACLLSRSPPPCLRRL